MIRRPLRRAIAAALFPTLAAALPALARADATVPPPRPKENRAPHRGTPAPPPKRPPRLGGDISAPLRPDGTSARMLLHRHAPHEPCEETACSPEEA